MSKPSVGYNGNEKLKLPGTIIHMSQDDIYEMVKCANDPIYWAEKYIKIISVDKGLVPIKLYDYQKEIIMATLTNRNTIVLTGRQMGKCLEYNTTITIKHSITGIEHEMNIGLFHEWMKYQQYVNTMLTYFT